MTQTLNIKYFYIQIYKYLIFSVACLYHPTHSCLLMLTYLAAISTNLAPAGGKYIASSLLDRAATPQKITFQTVSQTS